MVEWQRVDFGPSFRAEIHTTVSVGTAGLQLKFAMPKIQQPKPRYKIATDLASQM
jgi:hypothetical protein